MLITGGVITRREWALWECPYRDARRWASEVLRQRYLWMEILFGATEGKEAGTKPCRHPDMCAMCRKRCGDRVG